MYLELVTKEVKSSISQLAGLDSIANILDIGSTVLYSDHLVVVHHAHQVHGVQTHVSASHASHQALPLTFEYDVVELLHAVQLLPFQLPHVHQSPHVPHAILSSSVHAFNATPHAPHVPHDQALQALPFLLIVPLFVSVQFTYTLYQSGYSVNPLSIVKSP